MTSAHDELPFRPGDVIAGKYRIEAVLGVGGMGAVLSATHVQLDQRVALKFLLPHSLKNPVVVARFEREARAAVRLRSEHVARVIDVGTLEDGAPFMVMEYLDGCDLQDLVDRSGPLPSEVAVDYLLQASEALAEAHGFGIVHRDLKPQNLFLTRSVAGRPLVKVLDFGISKTSDKEQMPLTRTGDVMGSPHYMSPEQLRGARDIDARSDLWALGAVLYTLLAGHVPFDGETMAELCSRILVEQPPPLRAARPDLPPGLDAVIARCLAKDPKDRFADVTELARALDPFAHHELTRAADRVQAASGRPPPMTPAVERVQPPVVAGSGVAPSTADGWSDTELHAPGRPRRAIVIAALGGFAFAALVAGGFGWRARMTPKSVEAPASSGATATVSAPAPPVASHVESPRTVETVAVADLAVSALDTGSVPPRKPNAGVASGRRRKTVQAAPPTKPTSTEPVVDAPDLRQ